jgi:hypothetical protein
MDRPHYFVCHIKRARFGGGCSCSAFASERAALDLLIQIIRTVIPLAAAAQPTTAALAVAAAALGDIMLALGTRPLLAKPMNDTMRAKLEERALTDDAISRISADAFEAAVLALAKAGHPNTTVFTCDALGEGRLGSL